jgi:hypothetical protein
MLRLPIGLAAAAVLLAFLPGTASGQTRNPCSKAEATDEGFTVLARNGALRVVKIAGRNDAYACTPRYPKGLLLARGDFTEPCGSNSSRTVGVPDRGGAAINARYALLAVNVVNDNCKSDDGYELFRVDLANGRRTVVASGKRSYASEVLINAMGTAVWTVDERELRLAAIGEKPKLLLAGGAGSGTTPSATRIGSGRRPVLTAAQGAATFRLDPTKQLAARARCGAATVLVTHLIAAGPKRVCTLATGRSIARAGCTQARGFVVLCGTRLVDAVANRVRLEHPGLGGQKERVGLVRYDKDVTDAVAVPGGRAVIVREGPEETFFEPNDSSTLTESFSELVLLLPDGNQRVLRRTTNYHIRQLQVDAKTIRWRETGNDGGGPRSTPLPAAGR